MAAATLPVSINTDLQDAGTADGRVRDIVKSIQYKNQNETEMKLLFNIELTEWVANPNHLNNIQLEPHVCRRTFGSRYP